MTNYLLRNYTVPRILSLLIFLLLVLNGHAKGIITGHVYSKGDSLPIIGANIIAKSNQGKIISLSSTNIDGEFKLELKEQLDSMTLIVSMLGFKTHSMPLKFDVKPLTIYLDEGALKLKEIVVKADRIRENGDTVTYNVNAFSEKQDRSIGDVLNRMPGIDVLQGGKIQYQGNDINKFYIEGIDLLGGKYGIATNGINHEDVSTVEIMENHQPLQVLRGISYSDQAAINLKLKSKSKASILVHGDLGGGYSVQPHGIIIDANIFAMIIRGDYQNITTVKGNNNGINVTEELTDFTYKAPDIELEPYINISIPSTPNLRYKRSNFNRSWYASTNNLWKTSKGDDIKVRLDYSSNRIEGFSNNSTTYFLESGNQMVVEDNSSLSHSSELSGKFIFEANRKSYFLNNTLSAFFGWNDLSMSTSGTVPNLQKGDTPHYSIIDNLKIIKRIGNNRLITFSSLNQWESLPEKLSVNSDREHAYGEKITQNSVFTNESATLGFILKRVVLSLETGITGYFRSLKTGLWGLNFNDNPFGDLPESELVAESASVTTNFLRLFVNPKFEWSRKKLEVTLEIPVNFYTYFFSGAISNRSEIFLSPSLRTRFSFNSRSSITLRGGARHSPASLHDIHSSTILSDYRTLIAGVDDYYTNNGQSVGLNYSYRNAKKGLFINATGNYGWNKSKLMPIQNVTGNYIFYSYRTVPSESRNASALALVSKSLDFMRGAVGFRGNYIWSRKSMFSQGEMTHFDFASLVINPYINGSVTQYLNWSFKFKWSRSMMNIKSMSDKTTESFVYSADLTVLPCKIMTWTVSSEYYRNQLDDGRFRNMAMLDTKITFNINKKVDLSIAGTNLLNKRNYNYSVFGTLSLFESSTRLRGREFMITLYLKK